MVAQQGDPVYFHFSVRREFGVRKRSALQPSSLGGTKTPVPTAYVDSGTLINRAPVGSA